MENQSIFSQRLKNARVMCGFSMDELVAKMNNPVSKMTISKYETGKMLPDSSVLIDLANALNQKVDYFFRPFSVSIGQINFRKKASLPAKKQNEIKEKVADFVERYIEIEEICSIKNSVSYYLSIPVSNNIDVKKAAQKICKDWEVGQDGILSIIELLEEHSIKIYELDADLKFDGMCAPLGKYGAVIVVNKNFSPERKRFTALHELGHLILKFDETLSAKEKENLCHLFASEMLISEERIKFFLGNSRHDISYQELRAVQMQYGISTDAIMYKAKHCGIISEQRHKTYYIQKNKNPQFKKLVEASIYPEENSSRFSRLVYRALSSEFITETKAAALLNLPVHIVRKELTLV